MELATGNCAPDLDISATADKESRMVVTKDSDFVNSFLLNSRPLKLLLVSTGTISNDELLRLIHANLAAIESALSKHRLVELTRTSLSIPA